MHHAGYWGVWEGQGGGVRKEEVGDGDESFEQVRHGLRKAWARFRWEWAGVEKSQIHGGRSYSTGVWTNRPARVAVQESMRV